MRETVTGDLRPPASPRGQVLIIVAFSTVVLLLIAGLVLDGGVWLVSQRSMRNAADGAAQAGVSELARRPITASKQLNAATHAMEFLNRQLELGIADEDIVDAATHALLDADGFGADDGVPGYNGADRFVIRTPVTGDVSCTGAAWGDRALTVRVLHAAPRFMTSLIFSGDQPVNVCATSNIDGNSWAIAVLKPNNGTQPNGPNKTMKIAGTKGSVAVCGGDVGVNSMLTVEGKTGYLKFLKPTSNPPCTLDANNGAVMTIENPSPPTWSAPDRQVRVEGATSNTKDDLYQAPIHLGSYIQIPSWGAAEYAALDDAGAPLLRIAEDTPGNGTCTPPKGSPPYVDSIAPGKYSLIEAGNNQRRWLCPGVYHFVAGASPSGLQIHDGAVIGGQGVTLVFDTGPNHNRDDAPLVLSSGSSLLLNSVDAGGTVLPGAWGTGDVESSVPITIWIKPTACPITPVPNCDSSSVLRSHARSGIGIRGLIFGPTDEMQIAGNNQHASAGAIWAWTITYVGNSQLLQLFEGPDDNGYPLIVE